MHNLRQTLFPQVLTPPPPKKKDIHPLSVEDVLQLGGHTLSKADYYPNHLFIRVLCHTLGSVNGTSHCSTTAAGLAGLSSSPPFPNIPRSASPQHFNFDEKHGTADEGVYGNFHDPMADVFEIDKVPSVDPELGRRKASILVSLLLHCNLIFLMLFLL
jgi:hypothetical protein